MSIVVKPISAMLTKDLDTFGKMDPYVVCIIGNQKKRGASHNGGGKKPQWQDTFVFNTCGQLMQVQVWDQDSLNDDLVGQGSMNLKSLYSSPGKSENQYIDLVRNGKISGRVLISAQYQGPSNNMNSNWGNSNQSMNSNWGNNQPSMNSNWGPNNNSNWGNNQPSMNSGWGPNNNGWGNNQPNMNSNWGQNPNMGSNNNDWSPNYMGSNFGNNAPNNYSTNSNYGSNFNPNSNYESNFNPNSNYGSNFNQNSNNGQSNGPVTLTIKPIQGKLTKDLDFLGKMDPFVSISIGNNKQRTQAHQGGGKNPRWMNTLTFSGITPNDRLMNIAVFDQDVTTNQLVGEGTYDVTKAVKSMNQAQNQYIDLIKNGKSAGRVLISIEASQGYNGW